MQAIRAAAKWAFGSAADPTKDESSGSSDTSTSDKGSSGSLSGNMPDPLEHFITTDTAFTKRELPNNIHEHIFRTLVLERGPVANNLARYNEWINEILPQQISAKSIATEKGFLFFDNVRVMKPTTQDGLPLFPHKARQLSVLYAGWVLADITHVQYDYDGTMPEAYKNQRLCRIPIMVGSQACHLYGYSPDELRAVFESSDDPFGYFIVKGSDRVVITQELLAFFQDISSAKEKMSVQTSLTYHRVSGTTVVRAIISKTSPAIKISIQHPGMKGSASPPLYAAMAVFDALFQLAEPATYAYESITLQGVTGLPFDPSNKAAVETAALTRRKAIIDKVIALVALFIPSKLDHGITLSTMKDRKDFAEVHLEASLAKYMTIPAPVHMIATQKAGDFSLAPVTANLLLNTVKRQASYLATEWTNMTVPEQQAALTDLWNKQDRSNKSAGLHTANETDQNAARRLIVNDIFRDFYTDVDMDEKPLHLARLVAKEILCMSHSFPLDDRDSWANKRIKMPCDNMSHLFNSYFRVIYNKSHKPGKIVTESAVAEQYAGNLTSSDPSARDGTTVAIVQRDTQVAVHSQISRLNTPASRQSNQMAPRMLQDSQVGYGCAAETPSGAGCGLTKALCCTTWVSGRRDSKKLIADILMDALRDAREKVLSAVRSEDEDEFTASDSAWTRETGYEEDYAPHVVVVDSKIIGWADGPTFVDIARPQIKTNMDFFDVSIFFNEKRECVEVYALGGRPTRPLYTTTAEPGRVKRIKEERTDDEAIGMLVLEKMMTDEDPEKRLTSKAVRAMRSADLIKAGIVEYVSAAENVHIFISQTPEAVGKNYARRATERAIADGARPADPPADPAEPEDPAEPRDESEQLPSGNDSSSDDEAENLPPGVLLNPNRVEAVPAAPARPERRIYLKMYSEIDPTAVLGYAAALMPYVNTCQGPRVNYEASMIVQALGLLHDSFYAGLRTGKRFISSRPFVETRMAEMLGCNRAPVGIPFVVGFMSMADNSEDAVVVNRSAFDRMRITKYTTHKYVIKNLGRNPAPGNSSEDICRPAQAKEALVGTVRHSLYDAIGDDGFPKIGSRIEKGKCILGKERITTSTSGVQASETNTSIFAGISEEGYVDRLTVTRIIVDKNGVITSDNLLQNGPISHGGTEGVVVTIRMRDTRPIRPGDKFTPRCSQKGTQANERKNNQAMRSEYTVPPSLAERNEELLRRTKLGQKEEEYATPEGNKVDRNAMRAVFTERIYDPGTIEETQNALIDHSLRFGRSLPTVTDGPNKGVTADIYVNPAAIPTRMTIGFPREIFASKAALYTGERIDASAFRSFSGASTDDDSDEVRDPFDDYDEDRDPFEPKPKKIDNMIRYRQILKDAGLNEYGYEKVQMCDGTPMFNKEGARVFMGPCLYQLLRHNVADKKQWRAEGSVMFLTNQPVGGRSHDGGMKQGEMEKEAFVAHGAAGLTQERLMIASDLFKLEVCTTCGNLAHTNPALGKRICRTCPSGQENLAVVQVPYIFVLILHMVQGLGIHSRLCNFKMLKQRED